MARTNPARSLGFQTVGYLRAQITFSQLGTAGIIALGTLPAGSLVLRAYAVVSTVYNFGTNNLLKIGIVGADTTFGSSVSLATLGTVAATLGSTANVAPTSDTPVIVTSLCTGTAGTTGVVTVVVEYAPIA